MNDPVTGEDRALGYVLGELTAEQRAAFEQELDASLELRACVAELQSGTEALARAVPPQPLPTGLWKDIEAAVAMERRVVVMPFHRRKTWLGWAAAACVAGGLFFWLGPSRTNRPIAETPRPAPQDRAIATAPSSLPATVPNLPPAPTNPPSAPSLLSGAEPVTPDTLNRRLAALEERVTTLSQSLTQRPANVVGLDALRFFHWPTSGLGANALSPEMQRALALALVREIARQQPGGDGLNGTRSNAEENGLGVDFVDLVPGPRGGSATNAQPQLRSQGESIRDEAQLGSSVGPEPMVLQDTVAFTGFLHDGRTVLILDPATLPSGYDSLHFTATSTSGQLTAIGTVEVGGNPLIVSVNFTPGTAVGDSLVVSVGSSFQFGSGTVFIGVLPIPGTNAP